MKQPPLLTFTSSGFYCAIGDFYIDPRRRVKKALITHGHSDHARGGSENYLASTPCEHILRQRLGRNIHLQTVPYGEPVSLNGVRISFHPAGHILGSAQIRLEYKGEVWVVSGDYATTPDSTCAPFEPVKCHTFITEATFGLPIYKWQPPCEVFDAINRWWTHNTRENTTSIMFAYSLGKAQRIIAGVDASIGPIFTHEAVENMNDSYRKCGLPLPKTFALQTVTDKSMLERALIVTPSSADISEWIRQCTHISTAFASGWMQIRSNRKRASVDRGFVLSDHADWEGLLKTVELSEAETIWVTHGDAPAFIRFLRERGMDIRQVAGEQSSR